MAAKAMDVIALPDCASQTADAVFADTQVNVEEDPVVPLERNLYGHPLAGLLWESSRKYCWNLNGKKDRIVNVSLFIENNTCSHRKTLTTLKRLEKRNFSFYIEEIYEKKKKKQKTLILRNRPTSYHVYLGCTQSACKRNETLLQIF